MIQTSLSLLFNIIHFHSFITEEGSEEKRKKREQVKRLHIRFLFGSCSVFVNEVGATSRQQGGAARMDDKDDKVVRRV